jgi:hypothetical protein
MEMPYKGGAEGAPEQWEWAAMRLGDVGAGDHVLKLAPLGSGPGINLDALYLSQGVLHLRPIAPRSGPVASDPPLNLEVLGYQDRPEVRLEVNSHEVERGLSTLILRLVNLPARSIDVQYTLDGREMPLIYDWRLDNSYRASVPIDLTTKPGLYRYVAVKDSRDPSPASWIRVDVTILVK